MVVEEALEWAGKEAVVPAVEALFKALKKRTAGGKLATELETIKEELLFEMATNLHVLQVKTERLESAIDSDQFPRAWIGACLEAAHSVDDERVRLLAAALAGFIDADFSAELRSRTFRIVLSMEPSDVLYLRDLEPAMARDTEVWDEWHRRQTIDPNSARTTPDREIWKLQRAKDRQVEAAAMANAGCTVRVHEFAHGLNRKEGGWVILSDVGRAALGLVRSYVHGHVPR